MNRRAANALRCLAACYILNTIKSLVIGLLRDAALDKLQSGHESLTDSSLARLDLLAKISSFTHLGLVVASVVCVAVLALSLQRGRAVIRIALALFLVYLAYAIYEQLRPSFDVGAGTKAIWILSGALDTVAGMLPLVAAVRTVPGWKRAGLAVGGAVVLMILPTALEAYSILGETYSTSWQWLFRVVDVAYTGWFVVFGVAIARMLQRDELPAPGEAETVSGPALDGAPLRAIGWAILARVGLGVLAGVASVIGSMHGSYDTLGALAIGSTVIGVITTLFLISGLSGYAKYPAAHRSDGLVIVIALLVVGMILDIVGAKTTISLFSLVERAQHADSMWSMPSMSSLESMEATALWTGRLSLVTGLVSILILLGSLTKTARSTNEHDLAATSSVAMGLVVIAAVGALGVGAWMPHMKRHDEGLLIVFALVLLLVAVGALVNLLRVVFGVARAVEQPNAATIELPSARVV